MSTPALLENAIAQKEILGKSFLLADTTYKLIIKDSILLSPVITQDINRSPGPVAFILSQRTQRPTNSDLKLSRKF